MNQRLLGLILVAGLLTLGNIPTAGSAMAADANGVGGVLDMLERTCLQADGRFETFKTYIATGMAWGRGASCSTPAVQLDLPGEFLQSRQARQGAHGGD